MAPEITAVSKPKIRPPSEATMALRITSPLTPVFWGAGELDIEIPFVDCVRSSLAPHGIDGGCDVSQLPDRLRAGRLDS